MVSSLLRHYLINTTWFVIQHRFLLLFHALTFSDKDTVWFSFTSNFNEKKSGVDFTWSRSLPIMFTMCHKLIRVYQIIIRTVSKKLKRDEIVKCWWWSWLWQAVTRFNASANWIWLKLQSLRVSRKFRRTELFFCVRNGKQGSAPPPRHTFSIKLFSNVQTLFDQHYNHRDFDLRSVVFSYSYILNHWTS